MNAQSPRSSTTRAWRGGVPAGSSRRPVTRWSRPKTGCRALERYFVEKPAVVLLDLVMKGMYGLDVLDKLREMDPKARVIVVSADIQTSSREHGRRRGRRPRFLNKPVAAPRTCSRRVRSALARSRLMELTSVQQDALNELLNIGFGRAGRLAVASSPATASLLEVPAGLDSPDRRAARARSARCRSGRRRQRAPDLLGTGRRRRAADSQPQRGGRC